MQIEWCHDLCSQQRPAGDQASTQFLRRTLDRTRRIMTHDDNENTYDDNENTYNDNENPDVGETLVDGRTRGQVEYFLTVDAGTVDFLLRGSTKCKGYEHHCEGYALNVPEKLLSKHGFAKHL